METPPALPHEVWERTSPEAQTHIRALEACLETLASMVHALQEQVRTLQEQLNQTSQNSSRPPSSDPLRICSQDTIIARALYAARLFHLEGINAPRWRDANRMVFFLSLWPYLPREDSL
jgi:uncharacterized protein DUF6444